jgi:hypothetical protein
MYSDSLQILDRPLRIDHVENYRLPKHLEEKEKGSQLAAPGHAYEGQKLSNQFTLEKGQDLFAPPASSDDDSSRERRKEKKKKSKAKKERKKEAREQDKHSTRKERKDKRDSKRARLNEESF